jgi:hypothetical protein
MIDFLIVIELLPKDDAEKWRSFIRDIYTKSQREGWQAAQTEYMASLINVLCTPYPPALNKRLSNNIDFFFKHEIKAFYAYIPNVESTRNSRLKIVTAIGKDSDRAYNVQTTKGSNR